MKSNRISVFSKILIIFTLSISISTYIVIRLTKSASEKLVIDTYSHNHQIIVDNIKRDFEDYNYEVSKIVRAYANNEELRKYLTKDKSEENDYVDFYNISKELKNDSLFLEDYNIIIIGNNSKIYSNSNFESHSYDKIINFDIISNTHDFSKLQYLYTNDNIFSNDGSLVAVQSLRNNYDDSYFGIILIDLNNKIFSKLVQEYFGNHSEVAIFDNINNLVYSTNGQLDNDRVVKDHLSTKNDKELLKVSNSYYYTNNYIESFKLDLITRIDTKSVISDNNLSSFVVTTNIVISIITILIVIYLFHKYTESLKKIIRSISLFERKKLYYNENKEVLALCESYNTMLDQIDDYTKKSIEREKQKRELELNALQMQINPHFIYNTLSTIKFLVWQNEPNKVSKTIDSLIELLRNAISNKNQLITLEEDIVNLNNYIYINKTRYGEFIDAQVYCPDEIKQYKILKLLIQPFVENAYFHAFQIKKEGTIKILIDEQDNNLMIDIIDNGDGIEFDEDNSKFFSGIGVSNVIERIKLYYGEEYTVSINSKVKVGTSIRIILPISK